MNIKYPIKIKNKKTAMFLVFLGISTIMWLLIKMSHEYTIETSAPLSYKDLPMEKLLMNKPLTSLSFSISDFGYRLIGISMFNISDSLPIHFSEFRKIKSVSMQEKYYLLSTQLYGKLNSIGNKNAVKNIYQQDSIILIFEEKSKKKIPINPLFSIQLAPQYQLKKPIKIEPDSVLVFGGKEDLKKINSLNCQEQSFSNISESFQKIIPLIIPEKISCNTKQIKLIAEVEKFTEAEIEIPIPYDSEKRKIFPRSLSIRYTVSLTDYHKIKAEDFTIKTQIDSLSIGKIILQINNYPNTIKVIDFKPKMAEYIIIKE